MTLLRDISLKTCQNSSNGGCCPVGTVCEGSGGCCPEGTACRGAAPWCGEQYAVPCDNYDFCCLQDQYCYLDNHIPSCSDTPVTTSNSISQATTSPPSITLPQATTSPPSTTSTQATTSPPSTTSTGGGAVGSITSLIGGLANSGTLTTGLRGPSVLATIGVLSVALALA
ncbi:SubName: Full=Uncharacterized protein {ECO:0000313/EMBL:CCA77088.1} [Serendipita indica DSM 11827]|uniref:Uncharacterized protein n=1 Tax=Serendipita indica (strain DSM 11827) TaxID=1109443 RepID=G4U0J5_SERID|nr:SubName: Full=Uncharacterized protein {ECO:0000313/EMBL:CCA77088.1} [Serendipita indica DSM 11827]CCA77088.1 hypothetical protein PIIN_11073 [Serendipita indica DSM 11827]